MDFTEDKSLAGFEPMFTAYSDESCSRYWIGEPQFWIVSILGLTWPYRLIMWRKTGIVFFQVTKSIYVSQTSNISGAVDQPTTIYLQPDENFVTLPICLNAKF